MSDKAMIFDIQRNSFADGPGIRTTIFFKGCNLNCSWCHNPEGISMEKQMMFFKYKCIGCGRCSEFNDNDIDKSVDVCPAGARKICGTEYDVQTLLNIVTADKSFYDNSGGGITCSGGECMLQIDFLKTFLRRCTEMEINTAVDTAGNVPFKYFESILEYTNLFLYDIKVLDEKLHKKLTGDDNKLILSNFEKLIAICPEKLIARVPVIPCANGDEIDSITMYLNERGINTEFLPYHEFGKSKAASLLK